MALTRAFLKSLELDDDKVTSIIEAHSDTVSALQARYAELETQYNAAKETAEKLDAVQKELDGLRADDWKGKYEALLAGNAVREQRAAKETAVRAYYREKNIRDSKNLEIAMRGTDLDSLELDGHGRLEDTTPLEKLVNGDFKAMVASETQRTVTSGAALTGKATSAQSTNEVMNHLLRGN